MAIHPYGPTAWLIDDLDDPAAWARGLESAEVDGVTDIVPAERTVVVRCDRQAAGPIGETLGSIEQVEAPEEARTVTIDVVYDGPDLATVAELLGLDVGELIARHSSSNHRVAFCGFSPGFAYLDGLDAALRLPRRDTPRTRVPAGSVAIAAHYSAVYPSVSPGGWHLIGSTDAAVWNVDRSPPALLQPGISVRFRPVDRRGAAAVES